MWTRVLAVFTAIILASCQFTETLVIDEQGGGKLTLSMDLKEMMAFSQMMPDSSMTKFDTVVYMKDFLEEKRDSIRKLPADEQARLMAMEDYRFRTVMDPETEVFFFDMITDFKSVDELGNLMEAFERSGDFFQGSDENEIETSESSGGAIGVRFSFSNGRFVRDAYIKDEAKHKAQLDSLKTAESFMSGVRYTLKYTFPRKIKSASADDARLTLDGRTIELDRSFLAFMRDPDLLDLEVELED